ncbi:hypothetical protein EVAR_32969_1 [Eumeta japonica]|uniref:Uncharacterized protein n=1 Tax=Eumeta variegata TaxID=151549 RepID=A0A4C1X057_EUMVA|nr:hypothetical protein EVAR_32969_1 [Eumeta japonica]
MVAERSYALPSHEVMPHARDNSPSARPMQSRSCNVNASRETAKLTLQLLAHNKYRISVASPVMHRDSEKKIAALTKDGNTIYDIRVHTFFDE